MASQEDTDDLYADLYDDAGGVASAADADNDANGTSKEDEPDLILYEEDEPKQPSKASFIPPAPAPAKSSMSFIPPPSEASATATATATAAKTENSHSQSAASSSAYSQQQSQSQQYDTSNTSQAYSQSNSSAYGGGPGYSQDNESSNRPVMPHEMPEEGKMFVGGLNWDTTDESLRKYFSQFGKVGHCTIMRDNVTGRSRGFAFLTFVDPKAVNTVMVREHYLDGKIIDPKRAIPRPEQARTQKVFVGGLPQSVTPESFRRYFEQYGPVVDSTCMMDKETGNPRGFGFVTFKDESSVDQLLAIQPVNFEGKMVEVKRAQARGEAPGPRQQNRFQNPNQSGMSYDSGRTSNAGVGGMMMNPMMGGMMGGGAGGGAAAAGGGFDPQAMARMYQQMGWGSANWNPQMAWQQMMSMSGMDMNMNMGMGMGMGGMGMGGMPMGGGGWGNQSASPPPSGPAGRGNRRDNGNGGGGRSLAAPPSAGLPSRPMSGGGDASPPPQGRDHARERSPQPQRDSYRRERSPQRSERNYSDRQRY